MYSSCSDGTAALVGKYVPEMHPQSFQLLLIVYHDCKHDLSISMIHRNSMDRRLDYDGKILNLCELEIKHPLFQFYLMFVVKRGRKLKVSILICWKCFFIYMNLI